MNLKAYPLKFDGSIDNFFDEHVKINLPSLDSIKETHQILLDYLCNKPEIFIIRTSNIFPKDSNDKYARGVHIESDSRNIIGCDNEPAVWLFCRTFEKTFTNEISFKDLINSQSFPIAYRGKNQNSHLEGFVWENWGRTTRDQYALEGFIHAHTLNAKSKFLNRFDFAARMIRLLHPINHSIIPGKKFVAEDISEISPYKQKIIEYYSTKLPTEWQEFLEIAKYFDSEIINTSNRTFSYGGQNSTIKTNNTTDTKAYSLNNEMAIKVPYKDASIKRLDETSGVDSKIKRTKNHTQGTYSIKYSTQISEIRIEISWCNLLCRNPEEYYVGKFLFNLAKLEKLGVISKSGDGQNFNFTLTESARGIRVGKREADLILEDID